MTVPEPRPPAEATETATPAESEITEAWDGIHEWVTGQRPGWDSAKVKAAMREAQSRGAPYRDVAILLWRLAWDAQAGTSHALGELAGLNRTGARTTGTMAAELSAALKAGDYERARELQRAAVIPAVPVQGTAPAETDHQEAGR